MVRSFLLTVGLIFSFLTVSAAENMAQSDESLDVKVLLRPRLTSDFVSNKTSMDFDTSGIYFEQKIGNNLLVVANPSFLRQSVISGVTATDGSNDPLVFFLIDGYFDIKDVTKGYADYGIGLKVGQFVVPFYQIEQYYQPFRFVQKPLDYRLIATNFTDLGAMMYTSLFEDIWRISLAYINGSGVFGSEISVNANNDNPNTGAVLLTTSLFPFRKAADALKDLSVTLKVKAVMATSARSNYNVLLGYKYERIAATFEYLNTWSSVRSKDITAVGFSTSCDIWGPFQALARWDYSDNKSSTTLFMDHYILVGMNTKWFGSKLQAALTYDQDYNPSTKATPAKRLMLATQLYY